MKILDYYINAKTIKIPRSIISLYFTFNIKHLALFMI